MRYNSIEVFFVVIREWEEIQKTYTEMIERSPQYSALIGVQDVVSYILCGHLKQSLYAWTSMFDLCIVQSKVNYPYDGPMLRISPLQSGEVEFRYEDSPFREKQWQRTVASTETVNRFQRFLNQLHWEITEQKR